MFILAQMYILLNFFHEGTHAIHMFCTMLYNILRTEQIGGF